MGRQPVIQGSMTVAVSVDVASNIYTHHFLRAAEEMFLCLVTDDTDLEDLDVAVRWEHSQGFRRCPPGQRKRTQFGTIG